MIVYICSRYSDNPDYRVKQAIEYCKLAILQGNTPVCPHLFYHNLDIGENNGLNIGLKMLEICDELWVFGIPSNNMKNEIKRARSLKIRIIYIS